MPDYDSKGEKTLRLIHRSLDERWRPEDVAQKALALLDVSEDERPTIEQAAKGGKWPWWTLMSSDFQRPVGMSRQLEVARQLFGLPINFSDDDVAQIDHWLRAAEQSIGKGFNKNDFKHDRLSKADRLAAGIDLSRRQYNKRFRLAVRMEKKMGRLAREQFKRSLTLASKSRLAATIGWDDFASDLNSACFIAYYVARCNQRSLFTNTSQVQPYDEACEVLWQRCRRQTSDTNWWAIAHVHPIRETLDQLDDEQKGVLLGEYFNVMNDAAEFLGELWKTNDFSDNMIVRRGNDSTTWNITAGAWNKLRDGWFSLMYSLGLQESVAQVCPGKVLRLMAADVASWHLQSGGDVHPDTRVWQELPRPWKVLSEAESCPKSLVESICAKHGVDPVESGWSAPRPGRHIERYTPTPELVHGVVVSSPLLAAVFRRSGVFSGKTAKNTIPLAMVDEIRQRHIRHQEQRRQEVDETKTNP
jgi:hypothetical protein